MLPSGDIFLFYIYPSFNLIYMIGPTLLTHTYKCTLNPQ